MIQGDLLTWNGTLNVWENKVKPVYSVYELTNYDNAAAKTNQDLLIYDQANDKWKP